MARVKRGVTSHARHKKVLKQYAAIKKLPNLIKNLSNDK